VVCEVQQATWTQSFPSGTACGQAAAGYGISLTSGQQDTGNDFGNYRQSNVTGIKYHDANRNGQQDQGEPPLAGWEIRAYVDANANGSLEASETTIAATAQTNASGEYTLTLTPGRYVVCEVLQASWTQTAPVNTKCAAIAGLAPGGWAISIASGQTQADADFGNWTAPFVPPPVCKSLTLNRTQVFVGRKVTVKATCRDTKGNALVNHKVLVQGAGVKKSARTNSNGVAFITLKATKVGIIRFRVQGSDRCKDQLNARGPFRPPLTGRP
jgi:SdrD B-like protein